MKAAVAASVLPAAWGAFKYIVVSYFAEPWATAVKLSFRPHVWDIVWHYQRRYPPLQAENQPKSHNSGGGALPKRKLAQFRASAPAPAQLPNRHRGVMRAVWLYRVMVVKFGRYATVLVARYRYPDAVSAGFLMIAQRLLRR